MHFERRTLPMIILLDIPDTPVRLASVGVYRILERLFRVMHRIGAA